MSATSRDYQEKHICYDLIQAKMQGLQVVDDKVYQDFLQSDATEDELLADITNCDSYKRKFIALKLQYEEIFRKASGALEEHRRMREYLRMMERDGVQRVKMFLVITAAYILFWGPLFFVTLVNHPIVGSPLGHEITLHISYVHAIVNPTLFLVLHRGLRRATLDFCCGWIPLWLMSSPNLPPPPDPPRAADISLLKPSLLPAPAHPDSSMVIKYYMETPI
nr:uncharacterized protein LOC111515599 [Leptinotarsa decemlineata]